jgi:hypothetical protein
MEPNAPDTTTTSADIDAPSFAELAADLAAPAPEVAKPKAEAPPTTAPAAEDWEAQWKGPAEDDEDDAPPPAAKVDADLPPDPADDREKWRTERLNKIKDQREAQRARADAAEAKAQAMEARLQALEQGRQQAPQVQPVALQGADEFMAELVRVDPEANRIAAKLEAIRKDPDKFATLAEYTEALTEAKIDLRDRAQFVRSQIQAQQAQAQTTQQGEIQQIFANYTNAIAKSEIPQAKRFAEVFEKVGPALHPEIRRAILSAPDADVLVASIVSDRKRYDRLMDETRRAGSGFPIHGIAALGEFRMAYQRPEPVAPAAQGQPAPRQAPSARLPATPSSRGGRSSSHEDMDPVEWASKAINGELKPSILY